MNTTNHKVKFGTSTMLYCIGATCCLAVTIGLARGQLPEPRYIIRWIEVGTCFIGSVGLYYLMVLSFIEEYKNCTWSHWAFWRNSNKSNN